MSSGDASAAAIRLATEYLAAHDDGTEGRVVAYCVPCHMNPEPFGDIPSRWLVGTLRIREDATDIEIDDSARKLLVDLIAQNASWNID
ncbi:hypothetical protein [Rhodopirellula islandica]|nr:hypothetical protein [Rhodopirellula islandica]